MTNLVPCLPFAPLLSRKVEKSDQQSAEITRFVDTNPPQMDQNTKNNDSSILSPISPPDDEASSILPTIPPEVIIEIMTYMPIKSVARFQLVSKEWLANIHDRYFIEKHRDHAPVASYYFNSQTPSESLQNSSESSDRHRTRTLTGLDGLLLKENKTMKKIFIWNPATKLVLELPDRLHHGDDIIDYGYAMSYIPATKSYKIVSVYMDKKNSGRVCCEVLTPGGSDMTWRILTFPDNLSHNWHQNGRKVSVISSGGAVHCLLTVKVGNVPTFEEIVSLDMHTERFTVNSVPKGFFKDWTKVIALDWDGNLGFAYMNEKKLEVVMGMEGYKDQQIRWCKKKKIIRLHSMIKKYGYEISNLVPLFAKAGEIWFGLKGEKVFSYTIETKRRTTVVKGSAHFSFNNKVLILYKPSLVSFEGMQPKEPKL